MELHTICGTAVQCLCWKCYTDRTVTRRAGLGDGVLAKLFCAGDSCLLHALLARIRYNVNNALQYRVSVPAAESR
jgi:hypothetical protein